MEKNIVCVIVTYNRKNMLRRCLDAICSQSLKPQIVYIVDNNSTDGTQLAISNWGYLNTQKEGIYFKYILKKVNDGGAGGFYEGMRVAYEQSYAEAIWVMDDDGIPSQNCLKSLADHLSMYDYISPLVVAEDNAGKTAFMGCSVEDFIKRSKDGIVFGEANPFNGILYSRKFIDCVGFPKKEMFIWGDEINYDKRARVMGFSPIVVCDAIHVHPYNRQEIDYYCGKRSLIVSKSDLKLYCMIRNTVYNNKIGNTRAVSLMMSLKLYFIYVYYYLIRKRSISKFKLVSDAFIKGIFDDFSGHYKYLK